ncbi:PIN domain-containing protein [Methyloligella sp. 2.7D]|uniref:PIN domain-containing protein n=1 Tax=unclassified Methyloligella TaxID=2625955 RepID=UPI00157D7AA1|nr:PIN domain-containing protein [Methyloligella sp. GL2]QKP76692.1 hypothetical protein HT051_04030 [Methyloligella sp. GL2]
MAKIAHLFVDTNVLVQCRPFDQLDWSEWNNFDEVHLIVSRPVHSEIDHQKSRGGDRLAKRARKASTLLREILLSDETYKIVRDAKPCVKLFLDTTLPTDALNDRLDYSRNDDRLVGTVHAFDQIEPQADVRLLTHDTGPMATAKMVGIQFAVVPDHWLLPPEPNQADKRIKKLEAEVSSLREAKPNFLIEYIDDQGQAVERINFDLPRYEPLRADEVAELVERLKRNCPITSDFGKRDRSERISQSPSTFGLTEVFKPASDDEIEAYENQYETWLQKCELFFRHLHFKLQERDSVPHFNFVAKNTGTRPAQDALITITATGKLEVMPPPYHDREADLGDGDAGTPQEELRLPDPPKAPKGTWRVPELDLIQFAFKEPKMPRIRDLGRPLSRDPNAFYYKPKRPSDPVRSFELECKQWRHGIAPEFFEGELHIDFRERETEGSLECCIHAENLSNPIRKVIPVRIRLQSASTLDIAQTLVDACS